MIASFLNKADVVQYVDGLLNNLDPNSALTTTIVREKSGVYSVFSVIDIFWDDTETQLFLKELQNICTDHDLDG